MNVCASDPNPLHPAQALPTGEVLPEQCCFHWTPGCEHAAMTILISLHRLLERLAKAPSTQHLVCPGPIPGRHTPTALWLCGQAGLHPRLGGKGALRFRAGQREAVVCPGVPGCQGPRWCHSADGSAVQRGQAAPGDRHQGRRASSTSERPHTAQGLFRCPKPPACLFLMYSDRAPKIHTLLRIRHHPQNLCPKSVD